MIGAAPDGVGTVTVLGEVGAADDEVGAEQRGAGTARRRWMLRLLGSIVAPRTGG
jgi:hypothetical protein